MANAEFSGKAQNPHNGKTAEDYVAEIDEVDRVKKMKSIERIMAKSGGAPPGVVQRSPSDYIINEPEPASSTIDGIPVHTLHIPEIPPYTDRKKLIRFFAEKHGIEVASIYVNCASKPQSTFARVDCNSVEDALRILLLGRKGNLIYQGKALRVFIANASRQRVPGRRKFEKEKSNIDEALSIAQLLPCEILEKIFKGLSRVDRLSLAGVCCQWDKALAMSLGGSHFDLSPEYLWDNPFKREFLTCSQLVTIAQYGNGVEHGWAQVILSGSMYTRKFYKSGIVQFLKLLNPSLLTELNLSGTVITPASLKLIANSFKKLKSFAIGDCHGPHNELLADIINFNDLEAFGIINNHNTSGKFLSAFIQDFSLLSFTAISCSKLDSSEVIPFLYAAQGIQNLYIAQCSKLSFAVDDALVQRNNTELKHLYLDGNQRYIEKPNQMLQRWPNDTGINVEWLSSIQSLWVEKYFLTRVIMLTRIRHLDLSGCCAKAGWWPVLARSNTLTSLAINKLYGFHDGGPNVLFDAPPVLENFKVLKSHLSSLQFRDYDVKDLPAGMIEFFFMNSKLMVLDIRGCNKLHNFDFLKIINADYGAAFTRIFVHKTELVRNRWRKAVAKFYGFIELDFTPYKRPEELPNLRIGVQT